MMRSSTRLLARLPRLLHTTRTATRPATRPVTRPAVNARSTFAARPRPPQQSQQSLLLGCAAGTGLLVAAGIVPGLVLCDDAAMVPPPKVLAAMDVDAERVAGGAVASMPDGYDMENLATFEQRIWAKCYDFWYAFKRSFLIIMPGSICFFAGGKVDGTAGSVLVGLGMALGFAGPVKPRATAPYK
jgi:hypothetical protein